MGEEYHQKAGQEKGREDLLMIFSSFLVCYYPVMKLFIFDMGNVFLTGIAVLKGMAGAFGIDEDQLRADYSANEHQLMDGSMMPDEYYRHLESVFGIAVEGDPFLDFFHPTIDEHVLNLCDMLREDGQRVVVGSNTFAPHWAYVKSMPSHPLSHFDALYASHIIHLAKPDTAFWKYICDTEHCSADETVFIDDLEENCQAAMSIGIRAFQYKGENRLERLCSFIGEL